MWVGSLCLYVCVCVYVKMCVNADVWVCRTYRPHTHPTLSVHMNRNIQLWMNFFFFLNNTGLQLIKADTCELCVCCLNEIFNDTSLSVLYRWRERHTRFYSTQGTNILANMTEKKVIINKKKTVAFLNQNYWVGRCLYSTNTQLLVNMYKEQQKRCRNSLPFKNRHKITTESRKVLWMNFLWVQIGRSCVL